MKFLKGYWTDYSYMAIYEDDDGNQKKMPFVNQKEAEGYFAIRKKPDPIVEKKPRKTPVRKRRGF